MDAEPAPPGPEGSLVEPLPEGGDLDRVLASQDLERIAAPKMGRGHLQEGFDGRGRRIGLADSEAAVFVHDAHDHGVNGPVQVVAILVRGGDGDRLDPRYPGHGLPSRSGPGSRAYTTLQRGQNPGVARSQFRFDRTQRAARLKEM